MITTPSFFERSPESLNVDTFDAELLDAVLDHWHAELMVSENCDETLRFLGVSLTLARSLRLGVSDRTLGLRIPGRRWKAGLLMRTRLEEFGILRTSGRRGLSRLSGGSLDLRGRRDGHLRPTSRTQS